MGHLEQAAIDFIRSVYSAIGWPGVVVLMIIESAAIPLPSEIIMPFAAWFLIVDKGLGPEWLFLLAFLGALGNLVGALLLYWVGLVGARPLVERYGRYVFMTPHDLTRAERWFTRYGEIAVFVSRLLPVARTFISLPAGTARMNIARFSLFTLVGSFPFALAFAYAGYLLGQNWDQIEKHGNIINVLIAALIIAAIGWFLWRRMLSKGRKVSSGGQGPVG